MISFRVTLHVLALDHFGHRNERATGHRCGCCWLRCVRFGGSVLTHQIPGPCPRVPAFAGCSSQHQGEVVERVALHCQLSAFDQLRIRFLKSGISSCREHNSERPASTGFLYRHCRCRRRLSWYSTDHPSWCRTFEASGSPLEWQQRKQQR